MYIETERNDFLLGLVVRRTLHARVIYLFMVCGSKKLQILDPKYFCKEIYCAKRLTQEYKISYIDRLNVTTIYNAIFLERL